ncbi:N-acetyltransferase family protein [Peribacillus sp. B-H-3]|uniref:GNAT family N-acetyltransferase n=1 Tax=Peribacillus sp. B-H-3 TaxID=3400420 RepID=UPI003B022EEF
MEIRKPSENELEEIMRLSPQAMFEGTLGSVMPNDEKIKQLVQPLLQKGCYYLIASEEDQLMGWVLLGQSKDSFTDEAIGFIYELYVKQEFRGKGISKQLMSSGIDSLKKERNREIRLNVFSENQAIELYKKMGFSIRNLTMSLA